MEQADMERKSLGGAAALFIALIFTALALGAALAHAYALPNKIDMDADTYFAAQRAYDGWFLVGITLPVQVIAIIAAIFLHRQDLPVFWPAAIALAGAMIAQAIFWIWTEPANQATANWTLRPENWSALRAQWEYSHLAGCLFQLATMAALSVAALRR